MDRRGCLCRLQVKQVCCQHRPSPQAQHSWYLAPHKRNRCGALYVSICPACYAYGQTQRNAYMAALRHADGRAWTSSVLMHHVIRLSQHHMDQHRTTPRDTRAYGCRCHHADIRATQRRFKEGHTGSNRRCCRQTRLQPKLVYRISFADEEHLHLGLVLRGIPFAHSQRASHRALSRVGP